MAVQQRAEKALVLVVLLEELLGKATLLGGKVQDFAVVELASELLGQPLSYLATARP